MRAATARHLAWACLVLTGVVASAAERPDIVLIMVDDMGFSDLGCYGGEIETPHLDALAAGGVRFSQFYNSSRCCPTRATLMTGLHPHQVGIGHMVNAPGKVRQGPPAYQGYLNRECVTLGEVLRDAGYATLMAGKWHLGMHARDRWPRSRGFDRYYGCPAGGTNYFTPGGDRSIVLDDEVVETPESTTDRRYYTTDAYTDYAIRFVEEETDKGDKPFFLYLAYTAPHWPLHAHEEDVAKYRGEYRMGWDELREQRFQRQVELGLIDREWGLSPRDERVPAWDTLGEAKRDEMDLRMALYAAMVDRVDQNIGKLVARLRGLDRLDNTLLLFLSDNGACAEGGVLGGGQVLDAEARDSKFGTISYGVAWANVSSTPYRLYKRFTHEGGACTPFFAHWPDRISPRSEWYRDPAQIMDVMPTLLEVADAEYPDTYDGNPIPPLDGVSLTPTFDGLPLDRPGPICTEHENHAMVRDGRWKLVGRGVAGKKRVHPRKWELYDMHADGVELDNLIDTRPEIATSLAEQWRVWAERVGVYPKVLEN